MSKHHVLVVNDDSVVSMITTRILENHGYRVSTAKDGEAALAFLRESTPDLMILDVQIPNLDGVRVAADMKESVPFLIQTSLPDDDPRVVMLMDLGALGRVSTRSLLSDVERVFSGRPVTYKRGSRRA